MFPGPGCRYTQPVRMRLDQALVERGLFDSREKAKRAILAGQVYVNGRRAGKGSDPVTVADELTRAEGEKYVSRGGLKLEHALRHFGIEVQGARAVDLGASTGGFTDCLLQHGAASVCAVDVGQGQLAWKLRQHPRVCVLERTNARNLSVSMLPPERLPADLVVADCSFISLRKILPAAVALLRPSGRIVALVKPQFEAGKAEADRTAGVIRDPAIHERVLKELKEFVETDLKMQWSGFVESPILGPAGNKEFLALIENIRT